MKNLSYFAWIVALIATLGSIYMSQVLRFTPCTLCWYQRIFMFPLLFILTVGILTKDKKMYLYVLPLSITGLIISIYHNLIYYGFISESLSPCYQGVACNTKQLELFGFITIPLLSLISFSAITAFMLILRRSNK